MKDFLRTLKILLFISIQMAGELDVMADPHQIVFCTATIQEEPEESECMPVRVNLLPEEAAREMPEVAAGGILSLHRCKMTDQDLETFVRLLSATREDLSRIRYLLLSANNLTSDSGNTFKALFERNKELEISLWGCPAFIGTSLKISLGNLKEILTPEMMGRLIVLSYTTLAAKAAGRSIREDEGLALLSESFLLNHREFYETMGAIGYDKAFSDWEDQVGEGKISNPWETFPKE